MLDRLGDPPVLVQSEPLPGASLVSCAMRTLAPLHIFYAGTHTDLHGRSVTFSAADVAATARAYDPSLLEAPLVVGHPKTDDPAYGWVEALVLAGTQLTDLEAIPCKVDAAFAAMVNEERFNRISASFFLPDAPMNPVPGVYYLRHVGFLGAAAPALKGMRKPQFDLAADADYTLTLEFSLPETPMADPSPHQTQTTDFAAREAAITQAEVAIQAKESALQAREAALAQADAERAREKALEFAEGHVQAGRLLPRQKTGLVELLLALPDAPLAFADGDSGQTVSVAPRAWLQQFLNDLPAQVEFSERTAPDPAGNAGATAQFSAPAGYTVNAQQLQLHQRAMDLAQRKNIPYADALRALTP